MRTFIVRARKSPSGKFELNELVKSGRIDLVCRCVSNALWVSNGVRENVIIKLVLEGGKKNSVITIDSNKIKGLKADEKNIAFHLNKVLRKRPVEGITIEEGSFEGVIKQYDNLFYLDKKGKDIRSVKFFGNPAFVIGDYIGLPPKTKKFMDRLGAGKLSLGPTMLFASHCLVLVHNELDRQKLF